MDYPQFEHVDATLEELLRLDDALNERAAALEEDAASTPSLASLVAETPVLVPATAGLTKTTTSSSFDDRAAGNLHHFVHNELASVNGAQHVLIEAGYVDSLIATGSSASNSSGHPVDHKSNSDALLEQLLGFDVDEALDGTVESAVLEPFQVAASGDGVGDMSLSEEPRGRENPTVHNTNEALDAQLSTLCDGTAYTPDWESLTGLQSKVGVQVDFSGPTETIHEVVDRAESSEEFKSTANTTRKRQAEELKFLRVKVKELEKQLSELQEPDSSGSVSSSSSSSEPFTSLEPRDRDKEAGTEATEGNCSTMTRMSGMELRAPDYQHLDLSAPRSSLWKRVAKNQQQGRQRAELENAKLREMVTNQLKIVKGLEKILKKRVNAPDDPMTNMRKRVRFGDESEVSVFAKLAKDLDARFLETEQVFNENGFAANKTELQNTQVKVDAVQGLYMEFLDSKILPFEMQKTQDALWRALARENIQLTDGHYANVDHTHDFITAKLSINFRHSRNHAVSDAKFVAKRFVDEDRVVFLWTAQNDAEGTFCGANGIRLMNYGWSVIERAPGNDDGDMDASIIQSCARIVPELPETPSDQEQHVGLLIDLVTGSFLRNMASFHQSAEDLLVQEALSSGQ